MARHFTSASSQSLSAASAPVTATALTLACWLNPVAANVAYELFGISDGTTTNAFRLRCGSGGSAGNVLAVTSPGGSATSTTSFSAGVWTHVCGTFTSATARAVYLNGGGKGTGSASGTPSGLSQTNIGGGAGGTFTNGDMAECAIWNVALTDADVVVLARGVSPFQIRPDALVFYVPIWGTYSPEVNLMSTTTMALTGTPAAAAHPRVFYNRGHPVGKFPTAAAVVVGEFHNQYPDFLPERTGMIAY